MELRRLAREPWFAIRLGKVSRKACYMRSLSLLFLFPSLYDLSKPRAPRWRRQLNGSLAIGNEVTPASTDSLCRALVIRGISGGVPKPMGLQVSTALARVEEGA